MAWHSSHIKGKTRARTSLELRARVYGRIVKHFPDKEFTARELKDVCPDVVWSRVWGSLLDLYEVKRLDRHWDRSPKLHRRYKWALARNSTKTDEITGAKIGDLARARFETFKEIANGESFTTREYLEALSTSNPGATRDLAFAIGDGLIERVERGKYRFL